MFESIFECRRRVYEAVQNGIVDRRVVNDIFHDGRATDDESPLWDYKLELPAPPAGDHDSLQKPYNSKMAEIVKDAVSLYNSHGGYLISGVSDPDRRITGIAKRFDAADLNKKIHGSTGHSVETIYREIDVSDIVPGAKLGLLFVPKRALSQNPAQFRKDAPSLGSKAYQAQSFYMRQRDICRAATTPEDFEFLYGRREIDGVGRPGQFLDNNLPPREQDFTRLIGREDEISALWTWLSDAFSPIKILSGLGGVGKTSIAYTFAERLISSTAAGLDRLIWLGAKAQTFSGELDQLVPTMRVDFSEVDELLMQILSESGCPPELIPADAPREEILELCRTHLSEFSYLLIVDNVDTLPDADQQTLYHLLMQICSVSKTKCVLTARRNLGAPRSVVIEVEGLPWDEFDKFAAEKADLLKVSAPKSGSKEMKDFYEASGGSPLFAVSILRLLSLGDDMAEALAHWRGSDGEAVREAAFRREVGRLKRKEARVLLVLCYLKRASSVELATILGLSRFEVQEAIEQLQSFGMTAIDSSLPGGASFRLSPTLALVTPLVEQRVQDHTEVKGACNKLKKVAANKKPFIADAVSRAMAFLEKGDTGQAVSVAEAALKNLPDNPDLLCLLGRCLQEARNGTRAKEVYQKAFDLGCIKRELFSGWISVAADQDDWNGVIAIVDLAQKTSQSCRLKLALHNARLQLGHERSKGGNYRGAIDYYETALAELHADLVIFKQPGDRADLWRQNEELVVAWLGAVRMAEIAAGGDGRRLFGAYWRALRQYRFIARATVLGAAEAIGDWLSRVEARRVLSTTARENLEIAAPRLEQVIGITAERFSTDFAFRDAALSSLKGAQKRLSDALSRSVGG